MATTNQKVEQFPLSAGRSGVRAFATFSAEGDVSNWQLFNGDMMFSGNGPVDAATVAIERSLTDPSGGGGNPAEVADATSSGAGLGELVPGVGNAWYRAKNKATFGPANAVTARTLASLAAAINGLQAAASGFAPGTAPQPLVHATVPSTTTMLLTAATPGVAGNDIDVDDTLANGAFGTPTLIGGADAIAAAGTLTFSALPTAAMTVTIGTTVYTFVAALGSGLYEVLRGATLTTARDNLKNAINATGSQASSVLTASANPAAGGTVRLGNYTYTIVTALTAGGGLPFEVLRGVAATNTLDNLIAAINSAAGAGTTYGNNTPPNLWATAAAGTGDTIDVTSIGSGAAANLIRTAETSASLAWTGAQLAGGTGLGVTYGADVVIHPDVTAASVSTNAMTATAKVAGVAGNAIATTDTLTDVQATGTLTFTPGTVTTQKFQIGTTFYIYAADPTTDPAADGSTANPWQVDVGVTATISLANLLAAINASGVAGVDYSTALTINTKVQAVTSNATTVTLRSILTGAIGNTYATVVVSGAGFAFGAATLTGGGGSWGAATLVGGAEAIAATVTLTMSGVFANTNTVTIEGVVYTVKTTLTPTAGEVHIAGLSIDVVMSGEIAANV